MSLFSDKVLEIAASQVGVREEGGRNRGPKVDEYVASVGLDPVGGYSWCAAFVHWCCEEAAKALGIPNPIARTASALKLWHINPTLQTKEPTPGSIFIVDHGEGKGHTGLCLDVAPGGALHCIEGNSNVEGAREGIGVFDRNRDASSVNVGYLLLP